MAAPAEKNPGAQADYTFKILVIGPSGVGKTSLLSRFCHDAFDEKISTTIGVDFAVKKINVYDQMVKLNIWDTAGQEKFRTLTSTFYRNAKGVVLVYDVSNPTSLDELKDYWLSELDKYCGSTSGPEPIKMVVANKVDMHRAISWQEGSDFSKEHGCLFVETSAKANVAVSTAFEELSLKIIETPDLVADAESTNAISVNNTYNLAPQNMATCYGASCWSS